MWRAAITLLLALPACTHHTRMVPAGSMAPKLSKLTLNLVMDRSSSYADSDCAPIASAHALRVVQGLEKALAREGLRIVPGAAALTGRVHSLFETCGESDDEFMSQVEVKIEGPKGAVIVVQGGISAGDLDDGIARMIGQMIDSGELTAYASGTLKIAEKKPDEKPQAGYVAVFDISDGAKGFPPGVMQQVTDYLIRVVQPRLSAIAETAWSTNRDFARFTALVGTMPNMYGNYEDA